MPHEVPGSAPPPDGAEEKHPVPSLRRNVGWTFLGNLVYNGSQWGIIVALAKLGSPEIVGRYSLALAVTAPAFIFSNMNLSTILAADAGDRNRFGEYLGLRLVLSTLCIVPVALAVGLGGYGIEFALVASLVTLAKLIESISDISFGLIQKHERMGVIARSLMMKGVLSLTVVALGQWLTGSLVFSLIGLCAVWAGLLLAYDLPQAGHFSALRPTFAPKVLLTLLGLSVPLGIVGALNSFGIQIPRYSMEAHFGERELGIYSAIAALGMGAQMVTVALSRSVLPRLSQHFAKRDLAAFKHLLFRVIAIGTGVGLVGLLGALAFGRTFLSIVYTEEYANHADVLVVVALAVGITAALNFLGTAATATRRFRSQVVAQGVKVAAITLATWALVPTLGSLGAAWTQVIGTLVSCAIYGFILARVIHQWKAPRP